MKRLYASVAEDVHSSVKARASRDVQKLTDWVHKAVMEKLDRPAASQEARLGPLAEVPEKHRAAVLRCIKFLRQCPEEFADTLDDILKSITSLERRVCRRK